MRVTSGILKIGNVRPLVIFTSCTFWCVDIELDKVFPANLRQGGLWQLVCNFILRSNVLPVIYR